MANLVSETFKKQENLITKIFVFEPYIDISLTATYELARGGLKKENILAFYDYVEAIQTIRDFKGNLPVALVHPDVTPESYEEVKERHIGKNIKISYHAFKLASEKYRKRKSRLNKELLKRLKQKNPDIQIYLVTTIIGADMYQKIMDLGIFKKDSANVDYLISAYYGGPENENPFCILGKRFQEKYFSKKQQNL